ncbi:MAG: hypothetical protein ABI402_12825 [Ferruginibacter sp.]
MKKTFIILMIAVGFVFISCKKDSTSNYSQSNTINPASTVFASGGVWVVTGFTKNGMDETLNYTTSSISISPDSTFAISNDAFAANGKWSFGTLSENTLHLDYNNIDVIYYDPWKDIQDTWKINSYTSTTLTLQSVDNIKKMSLEKLIR